MSDFEKIKKAFSNPEQYEENENASQKKLLQKNLEEIRKDQLDFIFEFINQCLLQYAPCLYKSYGKEYENCFNALPDSLKEFINGKMNETSEEAAKDSVDSLFLTDIHKVMEQNSERLSWLRAKSSKENWEDMISVFSKKDEIFADEIARNNFTFSTIARIKPVDFQKVLNEIDFSVLVEAFSDADEEMLVFLENVLSKNRFKDFKLECETRTISHLTVKESKNKIISVIKRLEDCGMLDMKETLSSNQL